MSGTLRGAGKEAEARTVEHVARLCGEMASSGQAEKARELSVAMEEMREAAVTLQGLGLE